MTLKRRLRPLLMEMGPWLLCLGSLGLAWWLLKGSGSSGSVVAIAETRTWKLAPSELGQVHQVMVVEGGDVQAGQTLVQLDTGPLDLEIAILEAEEAKILAEGLALDEEGRRQSLLDRMDLSRTVDNLALEYARESEALATLRSELTVVSAERDRLKGAVQQRVATAEELAAIEQQFQTLTQEVATKPEVLAVLETQLGEARDRQRAASDPSAHLTPLERQVDVIHRQLDALRLRRDALSLKAPVSSRVAKMAVAIGEVIPAGSVAVELVEPSTRRVNACLPEADATRPGVGDVALLSPIAGGELLRGHIAVVGARIEELPQRCWRVPTLPIWGRVVTIELDEGYSLVPGQSLKVDVEFKPRTNGTSTGAALAESPPRVTGPTPSSIAPRLLTLPSELSGKSRVEPSGWLWLEDQQRYLVVSDDTGLAAEDEHPPWLFTTTAEGVFDAQVLKVEGVAELNDLESITSAGDGSIYLLSSQSTSKKGKRPTSRTLFSQVKYTSAGWQVEASTSLFKALQGWSPSQLATLGLTDLEALEIEGMTRVGDDVLLGLKSPLSASGAALVWRLATPQTFLADGTLTPENLTLWGQTPLPALLGAEPTPGGISELLALPSGGLLLTSTPAKSGAGESGCLSFWAEPSLPPVKVECFQGARPEGLSLGAKTGTVAVVFDDEPPRWLELAWPR